MSGSITALTGVTLGALFGVGITLVAWQLPWLRSRDLAARVDPYLRRSRSASLFAGPRAASRARVVLERLLGPVAVRGLSVLERLTGGPEQLERRLRLAGRRTSADSFRIEQVIFGAAGMVIGVVLAVLAIGLRGTSPLLGLVIVVLGVLLGVLLRDYLLGAEIKHRAAQMAREFPTVADLLALAVAAGESPIAAMERVARTSSGALPDEFAATVADIRAGTSVSQALASLGARTPLDSLGRFGEGVSIAIERGTPLAEVLRAQAQDAREESKRDLMETAGKREIMMLVPVVFFVLPLVIVFAIFPGLAVLEISL
ncbi:type II secretion system F family protein [Brachybacterium paraconglomeratum]|uniref:type II secretion system F family protein n=1 Tax=Brachybacterium paraconglomeratum TaxID=173362 RepID=UPI0031EC06A3